MSILLLKVGVMNFTLIYRLLRVKIAVAFIYFNFGLAIWISFFEVFSEFAQRWQELFWNWDFSLLDPTEPVFLKNAWSVYLYSIEAGIGEEAARYINLILLLVLFKNKSGKLMVRF